jgi:hypothetical protein
MRRRRSDTLRVVGMATLLMGVLAGGLFASDHASSPADANTTSAPSATQSSASASEDITLLKQQMALQQMQMLLQQKQIEQMAKTMEEQKRLLEQFAKAGSPNGPTAQPDKSAAGAEEATVPQSSGLGEVASTRPIIPQAQSKAESASAPSPGEPVTIVAARPSLAAGAETSPLQIHIGDATITPVAFMDFTSVFRNHVTNGSIGTNFGNIPYTSSAYPSNLSEFRLSSENSRLGLRVDANVRGAHVIGYMEADFHGYNVSNAAIVTNSNTLRERVYWVDLNTGKFEIMGGQTWSLITPGRNGISPIPGDVFYSQDIDLNYQAGLVFGRIPELRFVYHPSKKVAFAFAIDSPDQYGGGYGGSSSITLPSGLSTVYNGELDYGSGNTLSTPNVAPDFIAKLALEPNKRVHVEVGGIERNFRVWNPTTSTGYSAEGGGGFINANVEVAKGLRLLTNNFWSDGGGRYIYGEAPDLIVHGDGSISLVHSGSTVEGFEFTHKNSMIYAYYGCIYISRNTAVDPASGHYIGWGYSGSSNAQNRSIQEGTFGFNQTIWKNAKYGALNFMGQYSYLTRNPWFATIGTPANANINILFFNLRYSLPGSAPTMGK